MSIPRGSSFVCLFCGSSIFRVRNSAGESQRGHSYKCPYRVTQRKGSKDMGMFDKDKVFAPDGPMDKWVDEESLLSSGSAR